MEIPHQYISTIAWEDIIFASLRILLILTLGWAASLAARSALGRFEHRLIRLIEKGHQQGDITSEAAERTETLVRLLR